MTLSDKLTYTTLSNGLIVGNFSSPHDFKFTDGSILPAVSNEEAEHLKVTFNEELIPHKNGITTDVKLSFSISQIVYYRMIEWQKMNMLGLVDIVICPLPMLKGLKHAHPIFRSVRIEDRIKKLVSIDKFCIASN